MYEKTEKVKKTVKKIVDNLNDIAKATKSKKKGKDYLGGGTSTIDIGVPAVDSKVGAKLEKYIEKQTKDVKKASKKVKVDIEK
jgi:hypothetical protein